MRCGLIARKLGMSRIFSDEGHSVPVSVLEIDNCQVVSRIEKDKNGYTALQVGAGNRKPKNLSKALRGHFAKSKVEPKVSLMEFRVSEDALLDVGSEIGVNHLILGQKVDVSGISKGKGFAGVMKRHNFAGMRASHGVSISHRSHGSTGQCQDPGKVFKGKKMAGQLGNKMITTQNLTVAKIDQEKNLVYIKGSVPGSNGCYLSVRDSIKKNLNSEAPFPAGLVVKKTNLQNSGDFKAEDNKINDIEEISNTEDNADTLDNANTEDNASTEKKSE